VQITKECAKGHGQDRHLYALYCILQRELGEGQSAESTPISSPPSSPSPENQTRTGTQGPPNGPRVNGNVVSPSKKPKRVMPTLFTDPGYSLLGTSILSTSNCGNPALRLFGFAPVAADGFGIGYIIKDDAISIAATSKHLQTKRFMATIQTYLLEIQKMLITIHKAANERPGGITIDRPSPQKGNLMTAINEEEPEYDEDGEMITGGYSFFDSGEVDSFKAQRKRERRRVGRILQISEY